MGPNLDGVDLMYWDSVYLKQVHYASGQVMVSVEGGGSKGSAMVQGGFLERPTTRDINVWVINLTREPVSILVRRGRV
jgi:hypothetical protein